jgi:hypothetical protein
VVRGQPWKRAHKIISKITRAKWTGVVVQMIEYLLCKCRALSTTKEKEKEKQPENPQTI